MTQDDGTYQTMLGTKTVSSEAQVKKEYDEEKVSRPEEGSCVAEAYLGLARHLLSIRRASPLLPLPGGGS